MKKPLENNIENYEENNKFIKEKDREIKKEKNHLLVVSYITDENISRCWYFFSNILKCEGTSSSIVINYKLEKGKNTYNIGNEFSCYWIGVSNIHYKCIESKNNYTNKIISWIIKLDIGFSIKKTYLIYPITTDNRTLIKLNLELIENDGDDLIDFEKSREYYYELQKSIINKIVNIMDESKECHFIHESFIVHKSRAECWSYILDLNNISKITGDEIGMNFLCNSDPERVGDFWRYQLNKENKIIFIRIKEISKPNKRNTWEYHLETFGADLGILRQEFQIHIIKITDDKSLISFLIEYKEKITKSIYDYKKLKFKENTLKIKDYINNIK